MLVAGLMGRRERRLYRAQVEGTWNEGTDLFAYTKGRFWVRTSGVVAIAGLGAALCGWDTWPPQSAAQLTSYLVGFGLLSLTLIVALIADLVITARTARPGALKRQPVREDPDR